MSVPSSLKTVETERLIIIPTTILIGEFRETGIEAAVLLKPPHESWIKRIYQRMGLGESAGLKEIERKIFCDQFAYEKWLVERLNRK